MNYIQLCDMCDSLGRFCSILLMDEIKCHCWIHYRQETVAVFLASCFNPSNSLFPLISSIKLEFKTAATVTECTVCGFIYCTKNRNLCFVSSTNFPSLSSLSPGRKLQHTVYRQCNLEESYDWQQFFFSSFDSCLLFFSHQAGSHTACGRLQPHHTAAGMTGRERTSALVGWVAAEEPEQSHSSECPRCKNRQMD